MSNPHPRWGEVSRRWDYRKAENSARGKVTCGADCRTTAQNEVGTCGQEWHKTDTGSSPSVHANEVDEKKNAAPTGIGNGVTFHKNIAPSAYPKATEDAINSAALWLASHRDEVVGAIFPFLQKRFAMRHLDCIEVTKRAHSLQYGRAT